MMDEIYCIDIKYAGLEEEVKPRRYVSANPPLGLNSIHFFRTKFNIKSEIHFQKGLV